MRKKDAKMTVSKTETDLRVVGTAIGDFYLNVRVF